MNPLSIGKSIFVCLIKIINYLGYEKNDIHFMHSDRFAFGLLTIREGGNLAASKIRNLECPSYEICLIDYGCGKFNRKIHIMEQYP